MERLKERLSREVSAATTNRDLALLNGIFSKAMTWGKTKDRPVKGVKKFEMQLINSV
ncbi:MAG: hypothetical protein ACE5JU_06670 [Candidatus Binatia bacterium]